MHVRAARLLAAVGLAAGTALVAAAATTGVAQAGPAYTPPPIGHVWVIELENKSFGDAFTPTAGNQYLATTLPSEGALLRQYYGTGHNSLDNYLSEISGQAPNAYAQADCPSFVDVTPGLAAPSDGQVLGQGCVYPSSVQTLATQLTEHGDSWHGYMEDLGNDPTRDNTSATDPRCGDPVLQTVPMKEDPTQTAAADDQYAARHNPFAYFHSLIDVPAGATVSPCQANVGPLVNPTTHVDQLAKDLSSVATTPAFSFITPNLCDDAHDSTCAGKNLAGNDQGGLLAANYWLQKYVPEITSSPAFQQDGVLIVTVDEATDFTVDASSCCNEPSGYNTGPNLSTTIPGFPTIVGPGITGSGGGRTGTVVISKYTRPGTVTDVPYNHYSLLRSLEDELHLGATTTIPGADGQGHLGYAGQAGLVTFHDDVFNAVPGTVAGTTGATTGSTGSTGSTGTTTGAGTTRSGTGALAVTGGDPAVPIAGALLVAAGGGLAMARHRRGER